MVAVAGIDFDVHRGECFGFLGPNGAGKTTTMRMVYGMAAIGAGRLDVLGLDITIQAREVKAAVGVVPQRDNLDRDLSAQLILLTQADFHGVRAPRALDRVDELLRFADLSERRDARPDELSGGMRRRLLIARALVARPALVVLDEPTTGLDPRARAGVWSTLSALREEGVTLLLTTHYMEEAARLCNRLAIMDRGRIVDGGSPTELVSRHGQADLEGVFLHLTGHHLAA